MKKLLAALVAEPRNRELVVRISPATVELYQSVLVTVEGPAPVLGELPVDRVAVLTMADGRDARRTLARWPPHPSRR